MKMMVIIISGYCLVPRAVLAGNVGADFGVMINPFGDDEYITSSSVSSLTSTQIANLVFLGIFEFIESTISHIGVYQIY